MVELLPAFAKNVAHVNEREIGVIFALDSVGIVIFQLPIVKLVEGRRRMRGLALMGVLWSVALLGVWAGGAWFAATAAAARCSPRRRSCSRSARACTARFTRRSPPISLPPQLVGRYLALASLSWQAGWIVGPAVGGTFLQHDPLLLWPTAAAVNLLCAGWALALERRLPERVRITPHSAGPQASIAGSTG